VSVPLPWSWTLGFAIRVTKLEADGQGGTNVDATFGGTPVKSFVLNRDVVVVGADTLRPDIEQIICEQIGAALDLAQ
jgi:hypothetical protein